MSLRSEASELAVILRAIVTGLRNYGRDDRSAYTHTLAEQLEPLVERFDAAVGERSRAASQAALADIKVAMLEVSAAATKGEIDFIAPVVLERWALLNTLFQESRYRGELL